MSSLADAEIAALEAKLGQAAEAFAQVQSEGHFLEGRDAERIAEKLERLHSQIMEVTPPEASATYRVHFFYGDSISLVRVKRTECASGFEGAVAEITCENSLNDIRVAQPR